MEVAWFLIATGFLLVLMALMLLHAKILHIGRLFDAHLELHDRRERLYEDEMKSKEPSL